MYDIGNPEINVTARSESEDGRAILYTAEAAHRPECCSNSACGHKIKPHVHSSKSNLIHDIRSEGKLAYIIEEPSGASFGTRHILRILRI